MRRLRRFVTAVAAIALASCTFGEVTVPRGESRLVVHAVLNPAYLTQVFLLERTLTGGVTIDTLVPFDPSDPVRSGRGVPVSGARIVLSDGASQLVAVEDRTPGSPRGAGVYRVRLTSVNALRPGTRYTLQVTTAEGDTVIGHTTIPLATPQAVTGSSRPFNRDRDTARYAWGEIAGARAFQASVQTPFGAYRMFQESLTVRLPGSLRNIFADEIPRVFIPGFEQEVVIAAVDTNFYDYYRSRNDPFTGSGMVTHLEGGLGVFGSVVPLRRELLDVQAPPREPIEGTWLRTSSQQGFVERLQLYVESPARNGAPAVLSGAWYRVGSNERDGFLGVLEGTKARIALLNAGSANDTVAAMNVDWRGDTLVGVFVQGGGVRLVRQR